MRRTVENAFFARVRDGGYLGASRGVKTNDNESGKKKQPKTADIVYKKITYDSDDRYYIIAETTRPIFVRRKRCGRPHDRRDILERTCVAITKVKRTADLGTNVQERMYFYTSCVAITMGYFGEGKKK